jgi:quinol monooxygenase YgiN
MSSQANWIRRRRRDSLRPKPDRNENEEDGKKMVVLAVTWVAKAAREADVAGLFSKLTEESRKEPGCVMYQVHRHRTEPRRFFIYEQYKDDVALEAHRTAPHFLQYAKKDLPKIADRVEGHLYEPLG